MTNAKQVTEVQVGERTIKVGDFFYASWGYDQTNINYFQVVGFSASGSSVKVREVNSQRVGSEGINDLVVPVPDSWRKHSRYNVDEGTFEYIDNEPVTRRIKTGWQGVPSFKWTDFASAHLWSGKPLGETMAQYGH